ncbi:chitotriosidase-1-like [Lingula anatina]|uniref:Chitotriosidase-1-like n=1 Tax=Lingula anatina TaxID=7574 RepID=A0A1S3HYR0_LINAN|nr:chitotriosidase-1-like [Lingula anatina]|eukprot:XP_013390219.1 chitotriosidase-1-like [Lingula anatina]
MKVGCWFTNWAQHRSDLAAKFLPEDIDVNLCTHIYYAFAKVDRGTNGEFTVKPYEGNDFELYSRVIGLKHYKPTLKVLLAVGGWTHGTAAFNEMSATAVTRGQFLRNTIAYLRLHGFDGLDYDWEYPGVAWRGSGPETKQQFSDLVKETRLTFEKDATDTGKERLLATASVGVSSYIVEAGYDIPTMNTYLDWTNLMSYDLHGSWEAFLGHHTALYARSDEDSTQAQINVVHSNEKDTEFQSSVNRTCV